MLPAAIYPRIARGALLVLLATVAGLVRLYGYPYRELERDELISWSISDRNGADLFYHVARDTHPPGHFLLLKAWREVFGDSQLSLRSLSALCGALALPLAYVLILEALGKRVGAECVPGRYRAAGLLTAAFLCVHYEQVVIGATARMYSVCVLLAALTSLILLRSLHSLSRGGRWWLFYGLAATAFAYCHYFAWPALAAQAVFAALYIAQAGGSWSDGLKQLRGLSVAFGIVALLSAPWLSTAWAQATRVADGFWIPPMTAESSSHVFTSWCTGYAYIPPMALVSLSLLLGGAALHSVVTRDAPAMFFLLQASVPWGVIVFVSTCGGRPLLQARYLVMSQFALICYCGVLFARCRSQRVRALAALVLPLLCLSATSQHLASLPDGLPPIRAAAKWLASHCQENDRVIVENPMGLHALHYYTACAGAPDLDLRCRMDPFPGTAGGWHGLASDQVIWRHAEMPRTVGRIWTNSRNVALSAPWRLVSQRTFSDPTRSHGRDYSLYLYERGRDAE